MILYDIIAIISQTSQYIRVLFAFLSHCSSHSDETKRYPT